MTERVRVREIDDDEGRRLVRIVRRGTGSVVTFFGPSIGKEIGRAAWRATQPPEHMRKVHVVVTSPNHARNGVAALSTDGAESEGAGMSLWRIRITMANDLGSHEALTAALAEQRVWSLLLVPRDSEMTADVIIELPGADGLDGLLGELHMISSQVFVSSAGEPSSLAEARPVTPVLR